MQLDAIQAEGIRERYPRHRRLAECTQQWATEHGFALMAEEGYRSPTVTTITDPRGVDIEALNTFLAGEQMEISNGYGIYKDKAFRIAHMGEALESDLDRLFGAIERFLAKGEVSG